MDLRNYIQKAVNKNTVEHRLSNKLESLRKGLESYTDDMVGEVLLLIN